MEELRDWLVNQLKQHAWSHKDLAQKSDISRPLISQVLAGTRNPTADFCIKVAQALSEPPEKVLKLAGILPTSPASEDSTLEELMQLARSLPSEDQKEILEYVRFRYQRRKKD